MSNHSVLFLSKRKSQLLEDIDALLGDELANIESMEEAFKSQEGKRKERGEREREELRQMEIKVKEVNPTSHVCMCDSSSINYYKKFNLAPAFSTCKYYYCSLKNSK